MLLRHHQLFLAEPVAAISVILKGNALTGEYTKAVAGSETTPYAQAAITSTELAGFKTFIEAYAAQTDRTASGSASATSGYPTITYDMNVDVVTITGGTTLIHYQTHYLLLLMLQ